MNWAWICSRSRRTALQQRHRGALYPARVQAIDPVLHGGGHERGLRPGTLNVPAIVGFGSAAFCLAEMDEEAARLTALRDHLRLADGHSDLCVNGSMAARLPQNLNVSVPGVDPEMLGPVLDDLAVSTGSACSSGHDAPSHVLSALGLPGKLARASIRFGLGRWTTAEAIAYATERVTRAYSSCDNWSAVQPLVSAIYAVATGCPIVMPSTSTIDMISLVI